MSGELKAQKTFISYSWSSVEHEDWVLELATRLVNNGVEVVLDKWDSVEGQNLNAFMQRCVNDPTIEKVLVVCDEIYANKADGFKGGVGTETVIISNEVYRDVEQTKFIAIVTERDEDGNAHMPTYFKGTKYVDMSNAQNYEDGYEKLLRNLYGKPEYRKPNLGAVPSFLLEDKKTILNSKLELNKLFQKISKSPKKIDNLMNEFLEQIKNDFVTFSLVNPTKEELEESVFLNLNNLIELRDVYIEAIEFYIIEADDINDYLIIEFFESIYPLIFTKFENSYYDTQFDHMKFFIMELMLYTIALLYKYKKYKEMREVINSSYIVRNHLNTEIIDNIALYRFYPNLIEAVELPATKQKYISNSGQLIIERANNKKISANELIEADFLIFLIRFINTEQIFNDWYSPTIPYFTSDRIRFISKMKSKKFYESCKIIFDDLDLDQLRNKLNEFNEYLSSNPPRGMSSFYLRHIFNSPEEIALY